MAGRGTWDRTRQCMAVRVARGVSRDLPRRKAPAPRGRDDGCTAYIVTVIVTITIDY